MKKYFFALLILGAISNAFAETSGSSSIYSQVDNKGKAEQFGVGAIGAFGSRSDYFRNDDEDSVVAAQLPLGLEFLPGPDRFDIYAEINPSIVISSNAGGFLTANLGARFYF